MCSAKSRSRLFGKQKTRGRCRCLSATRPNSEVSNVRTTFSMIPGSWQEPIRVAGAIQRFQRVRVADVDEFKVHWRCRWCYRPTWPVVLDTGAFYDCVVD